jgi:cysteine desulfurase/selenocysteine lyase
MSTWPRNSSDGLRALRTSLRVTRELHFLDYAATAPIPDVSAEAMAEVARAGTEPMGRHLESWLARVETTRRLVADLIGASPEEVAFTANTSTGLSLIAAAIRWKPGDRVLYPADDFPSNRFVWDNLAGLGVRAEAVEIPPGASFAQVLADWNLEGVRLVACSSVCYRIGRYEDVGQLVERCHAAGALVAVDAIQSVGAVPTDVRAWGCDFLACGGQKWLLGPVGSAFLYVAREVLDDLHMPLVGWASARDAGNFDATRLEFCRGARRLEPGLPDVTAIAGLGSSLELLGDAGWEQVFSRVAAHNSRSRAALVELGFDVLNMRGPEGQAGIVTVELPDQEAAAAVKAECARRHVVVTHRGLLLRVAAHAPSSDEDLDEFLAAMECIAPAAGQRRAALDENGPLHPDETRTGRRAGHDGTAPRARKALVTGASRGLGLGIAEALARRGFRLVLVARNRAAVESVARRLEREHGIEAEPVGLDLSEPESLECLLADHPAFRDIDVLVNNAASADAGLFADESLSSVRRSFEINLFAALALTRHVLPGMRALGSGAILNVVTTGARCALPLFSSYSASKGAVWAWGESLTRELAGTGITVTTFLPPHMDTVTSRNLGRQALAYYDLPAGHASRTSPAEVGERAVTALLEGRAISVPWATRLHMALNALIPGTIALRIARSWRRPAC